MLERNRVMAAAEGRAVRPRVAYRCFVQEDGKRAPKLACSQSASNPFEAEPTCEADEIAYSAPSTAWWLQHEHSNALDTEIAILRARMGNESPCIESDTWWRMADRNELASFVAQKSLDHIQNCDLPLPQPQKMHAGMQDVVQDEILISSSDWKVQTSAVSSQVSGEQISHDLGKQHGGLPTSVEDHMQYEPETSFRIRTSHLRSGHVPTQNDITETRLPKSDPSKAQLLEALRHSQTRAREAEKAAKQAYADKEDIIKLFFRQASQLFAYKQWLRMLQLEALYLQIKNKDQPVSSLLPRMSPKVKKMPQKGKRPRHEIGKYAVALALGLGIVSAGFLLGWTVGWMIPYF